MKKVWILLAACAALFWSCDKDSNESIVGAWTFDSIGFDVKTSDNTYTNALLAALQTNAEGEMEIPTTLVFNDNGTGLSGADTFTYTIDGTHLVMQGPDWVNAFTADINKKTAHLSFNAIDLADDILEIPAGVTVQKMLFKYKYVR